MKVSTCIVTGYGINADLELEEAFRRAGSGTKRIHINDLIESPGKLDLFQIMAFPGGFSFGDHLGSGKVFATLFKKNLRESLERFVEKGKLIIGICNGFQVLVKMGILPNLSGRWDQEVSLIHNLSGIFEDRWVRVKTNHSSPCIWTRGIDEIELPVRHGEGRFVARSAELLDELERRNLVSMRYIERFGTVSGMVHDTSMKKEKAKNVPYPFNPNGSVNDIASICDETGRIIGIMPHPEAFLFRENHPRWLREEILPENGLKIFENGVNYMRES